MYRLRVYTLYMVGGCTHVYGDGDAHMHMLEDAHMYMVGGLHTYIWLGVAHMYTVVGGGCTYLYST
jgi:hypothetical protein